MAEDRERETPGKADEEINKYLDILARDPQSRAFAPLAEAYRKAGLLDEAIETSREGLKNHPSYFGGRVALGRALFEKGLFSEAKDEFVQVVQAAPDNLMAQKLLGQSWRQLGNSTEAEKAFRMVLLLDPRDEEAQKSLDSPGGAEPAAAVGYEPPPVTSAPPETEPEPAALSEHEVSLEPEPEPAASSEPEVSPEPGPETEEPPPAAAGEEPEAAPPAAPADEEEIPSFVEAGEEAEEPAEEKEFSPFADAEDAVSAEEEPGSLFDDEEEPAEDDLAGEAPPPDLPSPAAGPEPAQEETNVSTEPVFDTAEMEAMAEAAEEEEDRGEERGSPFEMFTKEPEEEVSPQEGREEVGKGEEPFEQTFEADALTEKEVGEEIPDFDLFEDVEEPAAAEPPPEPPPEVVAPAPPPSGQDEMHADLESEMDLFDFAEDLGAPASAETAGVREGDAPPADEPFPEGEKEIEAVTELEEEIPTFDIAAEVASAAAPREEAPAAEEADGGTFDTETLAHLYVNQGFYGKAAGVYRRMLQDSPEDANLRQRLEEVLALERMEASRAAPLPPTAEPPPASETVEPPAPAAPPAGAVPEEENPVILELQRFLDQLKEKRK